MAERARQQTSDALLGSTHFVFYDADPDAGKKKKKAVGKKQGNDQELENEDDVDETPPPKKARGRKRD